MDFTGERAIPFNPHTGGHIMYAHIQRYAFATQFSWQKNVVDLACGAGYGSHMLSLVAKSVRGVDIAPEAVDFALASFGHHEHLAFEQGDMTQVIPPADLYVAFECLEHVDNPQKVFELIGDVPLVWSLPVNDDSRFHKKAYSLDEIERTMKGGLYYQARTGEIVSGAYCDFIPAYVLGVIS